MCKLQKNQDLHGGIRLWENNPNADIFVSAYVCFLFSQLNKAGFKPDKLFVSSLVSFLKNELKENINQDIKIKCFILYALALQGEFQKVMLNDLILTKPKLDMSSTCFLYMSALMTGIEMPAWDVFSKDAENNVIDYNYYYGSTAKDLAIELMMATDFDLKLNAEKIAFKILNIRNHYGHWGSSQANAWCYFALMKYLQSYSALEKPQWNCDVLWKDKKYTCTNEKKMTLNDIDSDTLSIQKNGNGSLYYRLVEKGFSKEDKNLSVSNGIQIEKQIVNITDMKPVDETKLESGKLYLVKLTIKCETDIENAVIQEFFSTGMEYSYLEPAEIKKDSIKELILFSTDIKDDRMYLFPSRMLGQVEYEFYYCVRTTIQGDLFLPACKAESMYNASIFGQSTPRMIKISKR